MIHFKLSRQGIKKCDKTSWFQNWQKMEWKNHIEQVLPKKNSACYGIKFMYLLVK